ncbi:MAG: hypothetical protein WD767_10205 [Alphaproteobacteria bacterium]
MAPKTVAKGMLGVWTDSDPGLEAEFNEWYNREHVNERADNPGFLNSRRYRNVSASGKPRYMALYDLEDVSVLHAPFYKKAQENPTAGTRKMMKAFLNIIRSEFVIRHQVGRGHGATVIALRREGRGLPDPKFARWLGNRAMKAILKEPGVTGATYVETENQTEPPETKESRMRPTRDRIADWALFVEGTEPPLVRAAFDKILSKEALAKNGAGNNLRIGTYKFLYGTDPE